MMGQSKVIIIPTQKGEKEELEINKGVRQRD